MAISMWNVQHYFQWGGSADLAEARQPTIEYSQVPLWIATEKLHLEAGTLDLVVTQTSGNGWSRVRNQLSDGVPPLLSPATTRTRDMKWIAGSFEFRHSGWAIGAMAMMSFRAETRNPGPRVSAVPGW